MYTFLLLPEAGRLDQQKETLVLSIYTRRYIYKPIILQIKMLEICYHDYFSSPESTITEKENQVSNEVMVIQKQDGSWYSQLFGWIL